MHVSPEMNLGKHAHNLLGVNPIICELNKRYMFISLGLEKERKRMGLNEDGDHKFGFNVCLQG